MKTEISGLKPLFESKLTSVEDALRELEALPDVVPEVEPEKLKTSENNAVPVGHFDNDFYIFEYDELRKINIKYKNFLRENGYANIDEHSKLLISKRLLKVDKNVRDVAINNKIYFDNIIGVNTIININPNDARRFVDRLGYHLLTTKLMYSLFIPYLKFNLHSNLYDSADVKETLDEMKVYSEWLEDRVVDKELIIGNGNRRVYLSNLKHLDRDGWFNLSDLNEFGYPTKLKDIGEFGCYIPRHNTSNLVRLKDDLWISFNMEHNTSTGIRLAKFVDTKFGSYF